GGGAEGAGGGRSKRARGSGGVGALARRPGRAPAADRAGAARRGRAPGRLAKGRRPRAGRGHREVLARAAADRDQGPGDREPGLPVPERTGAQAVIDRGKGLPNPGPGPTGPKDWGDRKKTGSWRYRRGRSYGKA